MPGRNTQMSLWWSGEAESMFVYYLTGAVGISFLASLLVTRSMRRKEPLVTELLHEDNNRDELVSYLLQITTAVTSGSSCPHSAKVFMQLKGHFGRSQFFHLRSFTGGKAMFQRGFTDIFLFKVPGRLGEIESVNLFVAGLKGPLKWKIEGARLYHPASGLRKHLLLTVSSLENVSVDQVTAMTNNTQSNLSKRLEKWLLVYHQWFAIYGNKIRLGAFTELVSMMCLFLSILSLLILSQMSYIIFPRKTVNSITTTNEVDSGTFKLTPSSFMAGSFTAAIFTSLLVLGIEVLLRNVKSKEKQTGLAYETICNEISTISRKSVESLTDNKVSENLESREKQTPAYQTFSNELSGMSQISKKSLTDEKVRENAGSTGNQTGLAYKTICNKQSGISKISIESLTDDTVHDKPFVYPAFHLHRVNVEDFTITLLEDDNGIEVGSGMPLPLKLMISFLEKEHNEKMELWNALSKSESISIPSFSALSLNDWLVSETFSTIPRGGYIESLKQKTTNNKRMPHTLCRITEDITKVDKAEDTGTYKLAYETGPSEISVQMERESDDEFFTVLPHESIYFKQFGQFKRTDDKLHHHIQQRWQAAQKAWSRNFVRELCDVIARLRMKLLPTTFNLNISSFTAMLMNICRTALQQLIVCCTLQSPPEHHSLLVGKEIAALMSHLSMEIILKTVRELFLILEKRDCATLVDLVLVSDSVISTVHYASLLVLYMVHHGKEYLHLMKSVSLAKDAQCVMTDVLKGCFALVVNFNHISWYQLQVLLEVEIKYQLQENCYTQIKDFVERSIQDSSAEDVAVKRLCRYVEEKSKQEVWEELNDEKFMFTNTLLKCQLINLLSDKIEKLKKKKQSFDDMNDLLPKEPKSRLQLMLEKRRPAVVEVNNKTSKENIKHVKRHVKWNVIKGHAEKGGLSRKEVEKHSHELGHFIENLTQIQDLLKKFVARQGLKFRGDTERLLAQATLHPHVAILPNTPGNISKIQGLYNFNNFLQLKRTEKMVAQSFEITSEELIEFLLKSVEHGWNLQGQLLETDINNIAIEILIKLDTLVESLVNDVDLIMHRCVKNEPFIEEYKQKGSMRSLVKVSVESLVKKSSLHRWSSISIPGGLVDLDTSGGKDVDLKKVFVATDTSNKVYNKNTRSGFAQNTNNNQKGEMEMNNENANQIVLSNENEVLNDSHIDEETPDLKDVIEDLKSLKNYLKYLRHGEEVRHFATQIGYMERSKSKREHICAAQINNMVDSYYMIEEGDDSQILTEPGLYQLEHDCVGESKKPLPPLVKSVTIVVMAVLFFLIVLYTTLIGGQFTTIDLQEWMCYYLMAIGIYGMVCEPLRACFLGWYMDRYNKQICPTLD